MKTLAITGIITPAAMRVNKISKKPKPFSQVLEVSL